MAIEIKFNAGSTKEQSSISAKGEFSHPVAGQGRLILQSVLGLDPFAIQALYANAFKGYNVVNLGYDSLVLNHKVVDAKIVDFDFENLVLSQQTQKNNFSKDVTFNVALNIAESLGTSSSWSWNVGFEVGQKVSYGMSFLGSGVEGETSFSFSAGFGSTETHYKDMQLSSEAGAQITLSPGEEAVFTLKGNKGLVTGIVNYDISLSGKLKFILEKRGKYYYNAVSIDEVIKTLNRMSWGGQATITNSGTITQHIRQDNFFQLETVVSSPSEASDTKEDKKDKKSNQAIKKIKMEMPSNEMEELVF